jgi:hypothetical protein
MNQDQNLRATVNQDGAAILDLRAGRISTLNSSGAYVWQALGRGEEIDTISEGLAQQTSEAVDAVKQDIVEFLEALKKQGLLLE